MHIEPEDEALLEEELVEELVDEEVVLALDDDVLEVADPPPDVELEADELDDDDAPPAPPAPLPEEVAAPEDEELDAAPPPEDDEVAPFTSMMRLVWLHAADAANATRPAAGAMSKDAKRIRPRYAIGQDASNAPIRGRRLERAPASSR
jgi:hypothetical protein